MGLLRKKISFLSLKAKSLSIAGYCFFTLISGGYFSSCTVEQADAVVLPDSSAAHLSLAYAFRGVAPDSVLKYTNELRRAPLNSQLQKEVAYLCSDTHRLNGDLDLAIQECLEAKRIIDFSKPDTLDAEILFLSAQLFTDVGQYDNAISDYQNAISFYKSLHYPIGQGKCLNSIALIYYRIDEIEKAQQYNNEALQIWNEHPYPLGIASSYTINGYIHAKQQAYALAIQPLEKASTIYADIADRERYANSLLNTGEVYLKWGKYNEALQRFEKSLQLSEQLTYQQIYVDGLNKLGQCYTKQQQFQLAENTLKLGLSQAERIKDRALLGEFYHHLSQLYQAMGNYKAAASFQQQYINQKDSIFKHTRILRIADFEVKYQTEEINQKNKLLQAKNQQRLIYIGFLSLLSLFIFILVLLLNGRYRMRVKLLRQEKLLQDAQIKQQKLENEKLESDTKLKAEENEKLQLELGHKQKELSNITLYLYQKNEYLSQLLAELKQIEANGVGEDSKKLRALKRTIQSNLNLDNDWERFKIHFDQVHEGFIEKLGQQFPALTSQDLRHCAYIRMNLSTKEIAQLINITPASVQKSRVRLKKKLELGREVDLFHFIRHF